MPGPGPGSCFGPLEQHLQVSNLGWGVEGRDVFQLPVTLAWSTVDSPSFKEAFFTHETR